MDERLDTPIAFEAYEKLAEAYAAMIDIKPHNAYLERPNTLSLLPDVAGKRVLDAGCGPGVYSEWLIERGAEVIAIDVSPTMVRLAKERLGTDADIRLVDIRKPLDFADDESFDIVLSALVMDYIERWEPIFAEFHRILAPGGVFVFSAEHPFLKLKYSPTGNYFAVERTSITWHGFGIEVDVPSFRRSLHDMIEPLSKSNFIVERVIETRPTEDYRRVNPEEYSEYLRRPTFICFRARKRSDG